MDAIVLAGGFATRMWPITRHRPKMLLPVGETTVIDRILEDLETDDRIDTIYLSTNEAFADAFASHLDEKGYQKAQLSIEDTEKEDEKFGVVGALAQLVEREPVDGDILVIAGDNLVGFEIGDFLADFEERGAPLLAAYDVGSKEKAKSYGLVDVNGDRVVDFQEKPDEPKSSLVSIACYAFPEDAIRFAEYLSNEHNPDEPGWYIQWLQEREAVYSFTFDGVWFDIGTPGSYFEAVEWALDGDTLVHPNATIENTELGETVHVMDGATVTDSVLEKTVVFPDGEISHSAIEESILGEGVSIHDFDMKGGLVTRYGKREGIE